jgi:hypothetical protein
MTEASPYAVPIDELESSVRVSVESTVESQPDVAVPHDLPDEDMALGRDPEFRGR